MKLTTKGRYAVTAVLDLALNNQSGPVSLAGISERQNISLSYLEQLFRRLRKQGLVDSVRGPGGGYQLAMEPSKISIAAVITAVDEKVETTSCGGLSNCKDNAQCLTHDLWEALSKQINGFLTKTTLGQLVDSHEAKNNTTAQTVELTLNNQQNKETEHHQSTSA